MAIQGPSPALTGYTDILFAPDEIAPERIGADVTPGAISSRAYTTEYIVPLVNNSRQSPVEGSGFGILLHG